MSIKNWPYWLKGGTITISIYSVIIIILILTTGINCDGECLPIYFIFSVPAVFSFTWIANLFGINLETTLLQLGLNMNTNPEIKFFIIIFIFSILFYFLIGSIIGWIIGKFKSK